MTTYDLIEAAYTDAARKLAAFPRFENENEKNAIFAEARVAVKAAGGTYDVNRLIRAEDAIRFAGERKVYANMAGQVIGI